MIKYNEEIALENMTYKEFEKVINEAEHYTFEYSEKQVHIFYNSTDPVERWTAETIRQPLFSISLLEANQIVAPYGFRLTNTKNMRDFNKVEQAAITLARTLLPYRVEKIEDKRTWHFK